MQPHKRGRVAPEQGSHPGRPARAPAGSRRPARPLHPGTEPAAARSLPLTPGAQRPAPAPLSLAALGAGGLVLQGVPSTLTRGAQEAQADLEVLSLLIEEGLLPLLPPKQRESLPLYLQRLTRTPLPYENHEFHLQLQSCDAPTHAADDVEQRGPGELQITLRAALQANAYSCRAARRNLGRIHPRLFGSLLVHLRNITSCTWPVITASDALEIAEMFRYEGCLKTFWTGIHEEARKKLDRRPTRAELHEHIDHIAPRDLYRAIGIDEVLPALKPRLCFSLAEMRQRCESSTEALAPHALSIVEDLGRLQALNAQIKELETPLDQQTLYALGEMRRSPILLLSGQQRSITAVENGRSLHEVQELFEEEWQGVAQGEGYCPNFVVRLLTRKDVQRANELLPLYAQSLELTRHIAEQLIDN